MTTYNIKKSLLYIAAIVLLGIYSCSDDSEYYKTFIEGGEISYTGKIDSIQIFPGRNRIKVEGLIVSDPKVSELRIYWDLRKDSVVVPIDRTDGVDTVSVFINDLEENIYNFELVTFDANGNSSISQFVTAEVYGERYQSSLFNRPIVSNIVKGDTLIVNFAAMDLSSGVLGSELAYTTVDDEQKTVLIPIDSFSIEITDIKDGVAYNFRTFFLPEPMALDTFYTTFQEIEPIAVPDLINATAPFIPADTGDDRWGILGAPWITNDAAKNHSGYGGWDAGCCSRPDSTFNIESGWGAPAIENGKIYQTVTLQPGTYLFVVDVYEANHNLNDNGGAYFVAAQGDGLPDVEELDTAPNLLGYQRITGTSVYNVEFTVDDPDTQVSLGQLTTQSVVGRYCVITSFDLKVQ